MTEDTSWPQYFKDIPYSEESSLNTIDICVPREPSENFGKLWVIFIHGGAWRDPAIDASSFSAMQDVLLASSVNDQIAGYASINYRLSPYPSHPKDPSDPSDPARNARHPDHINDVLTALLYLQDTYDFHDQYVLVGHSVGATLAFQVAMKRYWGTQYESTYALELNLEPPLAIVGMEGIYDIPALLEYHKDQPVYKDFVQNALSSHDRKAVSPACHKTYTDSWPDGVLAVIAHSPDDSLVESEQADLQIQALQEWRDELQTTVEKFELHGDHDEVWQDGSAADAIIHAIQTLNKKKG